MEYLINPCPKPRMTRSDSWKQRPCVMQYWAFKDKVRELGITMREAGDHITFILPMSASWSEKKKKLYDGQPHKQKPDKDNLEKALLDSLFSKDEHIWDSRVTKLWGREGKIIIEQMDKKSKKDLQ